jgi:hypothetical protein
MECLKHMHGDGARGIRQSLPPMPTEKKKRGFFRELLVSALNLGMTDSRVMLEASVRVMLSMKSSTSLACD